MHALSDIIPVSGLGLLRLELCIGLNLLRWQPAPMNVLHNTSIKRQGHTIHIYCIKKWFTTKDRNYLFSIIFKVDGASGRFGSSTTDE
jgi:hypothetical protein